MSATAFVILNFVLAVGFSSSKYARRYLLAPVALVIAIALFSQQEYFVGSVYLLIALCSKGGPYSIGLIVGAILRGIGHSTESGRSSDNSARTAAHPDEPQPSKDEIEEAFSFLGVPSSSTPQEIRGAYRAKAAQWHPDRIEHMAPELRQYASEQMKKINMAYQLLRERGFA